MIISHNTYTLEEKVVFERVKFKPPFKPTASYENEACFIFPLYGRATLYGGLNSDTIQTGESALMKCGSFINHWQAKDSDEPFDVIAMHITPDILKCIYRDNFPDFLKSTPQSSNRVFQKIPRQQILDEFMKGLTFYFDNPSLINDDLVKIKIKELILLLYNINHGNIRELLASLFNPVELSFKEIIRAHLYQELNVEDFATLTNTSLSTFKRRFKQVFNDSPSRYIKEKRLEYAAELLSLSSKSVTDVCFDCGFSDLSTFSKAFSKHFKKSPSEYRTSV